MDQIATDLDKAGFPRERRICIPGNHDLSQNALKPLFSVQKGTLAEMTDERTFNDNLPQLSQTIFAPKFVHYIKCESSFAHHTCCASCLGGSGWGLPGGVGLYCLNSALCSFAALKDAAGKQMSDRNLLLIDTRSLYRWMAETSATTRVLVMHHPIDWLAEWARIEIENAIADKFHLVLSGHAHRGSAIWSSQGIGGSVFCGAPTLFSRKADLLGYAFVTIDSDSRAVEVSYRQWTPTYKFVLGTSSLNNDTGVKLFQPALPGELLSNVSIEAPRRRRDSGHPTGGISRGNHLLFFKETNMGRPGFGQHARNGKRARRSRHRQLNRSKSQPAFMHYSGTKAVWFNLPRSLSCSRILPLYCYRCHGGHDGYERDPCPQAGRS